MTANEYKGWDSDVKPIEEGPGRWRIAGAARIIAGAFQWERPLNDEQIFPTEREALVAGVTLARMWINNRIQEHPLDGREAAARQIGLLERTHLLWEALRHLRQEIEAEVQRRQQQGKAVTDPPYDLPKLGRYVEVLEDGVRTAMKNLQRYHAGNEGGVFGEDWLRQMEDRFREETN